VCRSGKTTTACVVFALESSDVKPFYTRLRTAARQVAPVSLALLLAAGSAHAGFQDELDRLKANFDARLARGHYDYALSLSDQVMRLARENFGDERGLSRAEFDARYPITNARGFGMKKAIYLALHFELEARWAMKSYDVPHATLSRALDAAKWFHGAASLNYMDDLEDFALLAKITGRYELARSWTEERVRVIEVMFGKDSLYGAEANIALANLLGDLGRVAESTTAGQKAIETYEHLGANRGEAYRGALLVTTRALLRQGDLAEAERLIRLAIADIRKSGETGLPEYGVILGQAARIMQIRGDHMRAEGLLKAAIVNAEEGARDDLLLFALRNRSLAEFYRTIRETALADAYDKVADQAMKSELARDGGTALGVHAVEDTMADVPETGFSTVIDDILAPR